MNILMATIPKKSIWRPAQKGVWQFFCPQCRTPRRLPYAPRPDHLIRVFQVSLSAALFTLFTWQWFKWRGVVSFVPIWTAYELFYRLYIRSKVACDQCGFDPYLYLTDVPKAKREIQKFWRNKFKEKGIPYPGDENNAVQSDSEFIKEDRNEIDPQSSEKFHASSFDRESESSRSREAHFS